MSLYHRTDHWIDDFQRRLSTPVAMRIAEFCRDPVPHPKTGQLLPAPLLSLHEFSKSSPEERVLRNQLIVVLGPFGIRRDDDFTYWQGVKVIVGDSTVAAVLCRLNAKGNGGFLNVKLWDIHGQQYEYLGDPAGERQVHPNGVIQMVCDHMAAQYHVGFVEQDEYAVQNEQIMTSKHELIYGDGSSERQRRASFEQSADKLFKAATRVRESD
jgi:hypothetical protein